MWKIYFLLLACPSTCCVSPCKCMLNCSVVSDSVIPWTVAHQAPLSTEFSRQEYWSGLPFLPPGNIPNPGIKHTSPISPSLAGRFLYHCAISVSPCEWTCNKQMGEIKQDSSLGSA